MNGWLRRYALLAAFLLVLLVPLFRHGDGAPAVASRGPAVSGQVGHLVIVTPHLEAVRRKFSTAFAAWYAANYHAPVEVDFLNYGGGSEIVLQAGQGTNLESPGSKPSAASAWSPERIRSAFDSVG